MKRLLAPIAIIAMLSYAGRAGAAPEVVYFGGTCLPDGVDYAELVHILGAELSPRTLTPIEFVEGAVDPGVTVLALDECVHAPPSVRIIVWHGTERRDRLVELGDIVQGDLTRALALALAETRADPTLSRPAEPAPIPWVAPPPVVVPTPPVPPPAHASRDDEPAWKLRAALGFRYATSSSTPAGGAAAGLAWPRFGFGANVFGARGTVPIGDVTLWVVSGTGFYDLVELSRRFVLRSSLDLGAAFATGAAQGRAHGDTAVAFHAALQAGVFGIFPLGSVNDLEGGLSVGYASSLRAKADGVDVVSLDGLLLGAEVGLRFR